MDKVGLLWGLFFRRVFEQGVGSQVDRLRAGGQFFGCGVVLWGLSQPTSMLLADVYFTARAGLRAIQGVSALRVWRGELCRRMSGNLPQGRL